MSRIAIDYLCTGTYTSIDSYDSAKWNLGSMIKQYTGPTYSDNFIGPQKIAVAYPNVDVPAYNPISIDGFTYSSNLDWVFGSYVSGRTFVVTMYIYNRSLSTYTYNNYLVINGSSGSGSFTLRGFRALYYTYTGIASFVSNKTITGSGFVNRRIAAGARIGIGTTDPTQVTTWYTISTINSNTSLSTVETLPIQAIDEETGQPTPTNYVIEELRFAHTVTHATTTQGGLFLTKGVRYTDFNASPVQITSNTASTDNLRSTYWINDAFTVSNTAAAGLSVDGNKRIEHDGSTHSAYVVDATSSRAYTYNLCASDSIAAGTGRMTLTQSNIQLTSAQTLSSLAQSFNGIVKTAKHGNGINDKSFYFVTNTRLFRSSISEITNGRTNWHKDSIVEISPGSANTNALTSLLNHIDYDEISDRFIVFTTGVGGVRSYVTKFLESSNRFENIFMFAGGYQDRAVDTSSFIHLPFNNNAHIMYSVTLNGITHALRVFGSTSYTLSAIPISTHWEYTNVSKQVAVSPVVSTPNNKKLIKMVLNSIQYLGQDPFITPLNDIRSYFRTSGFDDDSGLWYSLGKDGDLSGIADCKKIQFKFEFQMLGNCWGIPGRLLGFTVLYDDLEIQNNHQPSVIFSTDKSFAWRFSATYSSTLPHLRVRLYNTVTNDLVVDDNTSSPHGTFEKTTNGSTWSSWDNQDKTNDTTYIRYTPSSLYDDLKIRAVLTTL